MAEFGMPFDMPLEPTDPDEYSYTATEERMFNVAQYTNGIFPQVRIVEDNILDPTAYIGQSLQVTAGTGLNVVVSPGVAIVEGTKYCNTAAKSIALTATTSAQTFDIVLELDLSNQKLLTKAQLRASGTVENAIVRTSSIYQICLASVIVGANATSISDENITDQRLNTTLCPDEKPVCGIVGSCLQYDFSNIAAENEAKMQAFFGQMSEGDIATSLQVQCNNLSAKTSTATLAAASWAGTEAPYTYTLSSITGITADSFVEISPPDTLTIEQYEAFSGAGIASGALSTNTITLKAFGDIPEIDLPIVIVWRDK